MQLSNSLVRLRKDAPHRVPFAFGVWAVPGSMRPCGTKSVESNLNLTELEKLMRESEGTSPH